MTCGWCRVKGSRPRCCSPATCSQPILWIRPSTPTYQGEPAHAEVSKDAVVCEDNQRLLSSLSQGGSPVPDGPGGGRRGLLPGSGGGHHWAYSPLHLGGCSQHLQRHADEPQLSRPHTRTAQLAAPPHQVSVVPNKPMGVGTRRHRHLPLLAGPWQNPPPPS